MSADLLSLVAVAQAVSDALGSRPIVALGLLFGAGVLTSLTPCIYPMIPITVGVIGGTAGSGAPRAQASPGTKPARSRTAQAKRMVARSARAIEPAIVRRVGCALS